MPVDSHISKVNDEIAVGADLDFQRRWWRFETAVWLLFTAILILDLIGLFGRGPLAKAHVETADHSVRITYERIERFSTPSTLTVHFDPSSVHDGKTQIWVSDSVVKELGNQRVVPEPLSAALDHDGVLYTFAAAPVPDSVQFSLQPRNPGVYRFAVRVAGSEQLTAPVLVMP